MMSGWNILSPNDSVLKLVLKRKLLELDVFRIVGVLQMIESMLAPLISLFLFKPLHPFVLGV